MKRPAYNNIWLASLVCSVLMGCTSLGPFREFYGDGMEDRIKSALPADDSELVLSGTVFWELPLRGSSGGVATAHIHGAGALTKNALYLEQWNKSYKRLVVTKKIPLSAIESVTPSGGIFNQDCKLDISHSGGEVDRVSFSIAELTLDCEKTLELRKRISPAPPR